MVDYARELELMLSVGEEAGKLALSLQQHKQTINAKADGSPVTSADLAVDKLLAKHLRSARPNYGWLSEESAEHDRRMECRMVWAIDPIDGTRAFIQGRDDWTVVIGLLDDGAPVASVIVNPARGEVFYALRGGGAFQNGQAIAVRTKSELDGASISAADGLLKKAVWAEPWPPITHVKPVSLAYRLAGVACGQIDAAFAVGARWDWDIAAGALLVTEAGGTATMANGKPLIFNSLTAQVQGFVAASPNLHQMLIARLKGAKFNASPRKA